MRLLYYKAGAAEVLSTTARRIDELRRAGTLVTVNYDGRPMYRDDDLRAYVAALPRWTDEDEAAAVATAQAEAEATRNEAVSAQENARGKKEEYEQFLADIEYRQEHPKTWLTRKEAAEWLGKSPQTLAQWAKKEFGPPFGDRGGNRLFYDLLDLQKWGKRHNLGPGRSRPPLDRPLGSYVTGGYEYRAGTGPAESWTTAQQTD